MNDSVEVTETRSRFGDWLARTSVIPPDETKRYSRFNRSFGWYLFFGMIFISYFSHLCPLGYHEDVIWIASNFIPFSKERIQFLLKSDNYSAFSYSASALSGLIFSLIAVTIFCIGYFKTVVLEIGFSKLPRMALLNAALFFSIGLLTYFSAFIVTFSGFDPQYPGNMRFLFWPLFPLVSGLSWALIVFCALVPTIAMLKFFANLGKNHGQ